MSTMSNSPEALGPSGTSSDWREPIGEKEEGRLIRACQGGDLEAFDRLILHFQDQVYGLAYHLLRDRDEAEDIAQEVFLSFYRHIDSFRFESRLSTWLYRVTSNRVKNRWKYHQRRQKNKHDSLDEPRSDEDQRSMDLPDPAPNARQQAAGREMMQILNERLEDLSPEYREIIGLRFVENLSYEQIATVLECSVGTVKSRINRARRKLRESMSDVL